MQWRKILEAEGPAWRACRGEARVFGEEPRNSHKVWNMS